MRAQSIAVGRTHPELADRGKDVAEEGIELVLERIYTRGAAAAWRGCRHLDARATAARLAATTSAGKARAVEGSWAAAFGLLLAAAEALEAWQASGPPAPNAARSRAAAAGAAVAHATPQVLQAAEEGVVANAIGAPALLVGILVLTHAVAAASEAVMHTRLVAGEREPVHDRH